MSTTKGPQTGTQRPWTTEIERQDVQARRYAYALMALSDLNAAIRDMFEKQDQPGCARRVAHALEMLKDVAAELEALGAS
jgi:hypothetical protein